MSKYTDAGHRNRQAYLAAVAEDLGIPQEVVFTLAAVLGRGEDFDALITELEDYADTQESSA